VLGQGWNSNGETGDCTAHAEVQAIRDACQRHDRATLETATIYASGEPCVMCAGAIFWANIRRVVYGIDDRRLRVFRGERLDQRDVELSCRDVFRAAPFAMECTGPSLIDEATPACGGVEGVSGARGVDGCLRDVPRRLKNPFQPAGRTTLRTRVTAPPRPCRWR
jgi:hypothetical protein